MKLSAVLIAAAFAEKSHPDPFNHPQYRVNELSEHVDFIFATWLDTCAGGKYEAKVNKTQKNLKGYLGRLLSYFERCSKRNGGGNDGGVPDFDPDSGNGFRKRRSEDERLNQMHAETAIKQLSDGAVKHWIVKFADRYGCGADSGKAATYFHSDQPETNRWYVKLQKMGAKTNKYWTKCGHD